MQTIKPSKGFPPSGGPDLFNMKTCRNLYPQVYAFENLYLAYRRARKGKRGQAPAAAFERAQERELFALQHELKTQTYVPGPYKSFYIHDPKHRLISAAPFRDRVVHHALCRVIEPIWERRFIFDCYANRVVVVLHRFICPPAARPACGQASRPKNKTGWPDTGL